MIAPSWLKRDYRAVSYALCSCVLGLILMRVVMYFAPLGSDTYGQALGGDALFALVTQLGFFLAVPFVAYKFYGKRTIKQTLEFSSIGKFKPYYLIALPLGFAVCFVTIGISSAWTAALKFTGYTVATPANNMPKNFVFGYLFAEIIITAILPAVCEEFAMRGGLLTTLGNSFKTVGCVIICAIAFGLFHQNIRQVFYTSLFGGLAAFLTIKLKSIYPAMLMHFGNNFLSVILDYAEEYDWAFGGGLGSALAAMPPVTVLVIFLAAGAGIAVAVAAMLYIRDKSAIDKKKEAIKDCAFDATNKRVIFMGEYDPQRIAALEMEKEAYGAGYSRPLYKPQPRDIMIPVSLAVVTLLTTVFTYVWGFLY